LFRVSTLDLANLPRTPQGKVDFAQDFFGREAFMTVSGQLNVEAYCLALTKVYTFGPTCSPQRRIACEPDALVVGGRVAERPLLYGGTESLNPLSSSCESAANLTSSPSTATPRQRVWDSNGPPKRDNARRL
jgi:hypothetical protein